MNAVVAGLPRSWQTAPSITRDLLRMVEIVDPRARLVDHEQGVDPDVPLGMPLRLLRTADQRVELREQPLDRRRAAAPARSRSTAAARAAAASRSPPRCARPADRRAGWSGRAPSSAGSSANSKRAANWIARSTRRLSSAKVARIDRAEQAPFEIAAAVERIDVVAGQRIPGDGVDGEVAPPRRLRRAASTGSPVTVKPLWPRPVFDSRRGSDTSRSATL